MSLVVAPTQGQFGNIMPFRIIVVNYTIEIISFKKISKIFDKINF